MENLERLKEEKEKLLNELKTKREVNELKSAIRKLKFEKSTGYFNSVKKGIMKFGKKFQEKADNIKQREEKTTPF